MRSGPSTTTTGRSHAPPRLAHPHADGLGPGGVGRGRGPGRRGRGLRRLLARQVRQPRRRGGLVRAVRHPVPGRRDVPGRRARAGGGAAADRRAGHPPGRPGARREHGRRHRHGRPRRGRRGEPGSRAGTAGRHAGPALDRSRGAGPSTGASRRRGASPRARAGWRCWARRRWPRPSPCPRRGAGRPLRRRHGGRTRLRLRAILFDGDGRALYAFSRDPLGRSACTGACARAWPPFVVSRRPAPAPGRAPA